MKSKTTPRFWRLFYGLPKQIQHQAHSAYARFKENPYHRSLQFKLLDEGRKLYSVRIGRKYRALGIMKENGIILWIWIGPHSEYDTLISNF